VCFALVDLVGGLDVEAGVGRDDCSGCNNPGDPTAVDGRAAAVVGNDVGVWGGLRAGGSEGGLSARCVVAIKARPTLVSALSGLLSIGSVGACVSKRRTPSTTFAWKRLGRRYARARGVHEASWQCMSDGSEQCTGGENAPHAT